MKDCNPTPCDCIDGPTGPQGLSGKFGEQGIPGIQGVKGIKGDLGNQGPIGIDGPGGLIGPVGNNLTGQIGPQGSDGIQGPTGLQGSDGNPGNNGSDGTDGNDTNPLSQIENSNPCNTIPITSCLNCLPCAGLTGISTGSTRVFNRMFGLGFPRIDLITSVNPGSSLEVVGTVNSSGPIIRSVFGQTNSVEIAAENSYTDNVAFPNAAGSLPENGLRFEPVNGSDCFTIMASGDGEFVVIKALFANNTFPTVYT